MSQAIFTSNLVMQIIQLPIVAFQSNLNHQHIEEHIQITEVIKFPVMEVSQTLNAHTELLFWEARQPSRIIHPSS